MNSDDDDDDAELVEMPFGKHAGTLVTKLPPDYLCWLYGTAEIRSPRLRAAIDQAHRRYCTERHDDEAWR